MKKILFILLISLFIPTLAHATAYTAVAAGGDWNNVATWGGGGFPIAGDTANIDATMTATVTVNAASACAILNCSGNGGTLAFGNFVLTTTGNVTLGGTITAGSGGLTVSGTSSLTSNGITFPGVLTFTPISGTITMTLVDNWTITGLVSTTNASYTCTINQTDATHGNIITCNGGFSSGSSSTTGTTKIVVGGGTLSSVNSATMILNNIDLNSAGTITIGTNLAYRNGTITYVAGTIDSSTNSSTLTVRASCTLNTPTANMHWYNMTIVLNSVTLTLTNAITLDGSLTATTVLAIATSNITVTKNLIVTSNISGAGRTITMIGTGTWSGAGTVSCNLTFTLGANTITVTGPVYHSTGTFTFTSGTITTTGGGASNDIFGWVD